MTVGWRRGGQWARPGPRPGTPRAHLWETRAWSGLAGPTQAEGRAPRSRLDAVRTGRGPKARVRPRAVSAVCSWCRLEPREPPQAHPPWQVLETRALRASRPGRSNGPGRCCAGHKVCRGYRRGNHEMKINVAEAPRSLRAAEKTAEITAAMTLLCAHGRTCRLHTRGFLRPLRLERGRF